jgi:hypothetical protein
MKIFKYRLEIKDCQTVEIPTERILSVEEQNGDVVVYAMVDPEGPKKKYEFRIVVTGHDLPGDIKTYTFLGSVKLYMGRLMFHVFYKEA